MRSWRRCGRLRSIETGPMDLRATYEAVAAGWDRRRDRSLYERAWLDRFLALAPPTAPILDAGCGAGEPIAAYLLARGRALVGLDFAEAMLEIARARFPQARWIRGDMRRPGLEPGFGGIVAWDSFFHLDRDDQRRTLAAFAGLLAPGGALLLTTGPDDGEVWGTVEGLPVPHASLSPAGYAAAFEANGLVARAFVAEDPACGGRSVWLARRRRAADPPT